MKKTLRLTESKLKELINKIVSESMDMSEMPKDGDRYSLEDMYRENPSTACRKALKMTVGMEPEERLEKISDLIGGYGVEAIEGNGNDRYYMDTVALYVNMGDTYNTTVLYNTQIDKYAIVSWGDWVERNQRRYDIR